MKYKITIIISILFIFTTSCKNSSQFEKSIIDTQKELLIGKWVSKSNPSKFVYEFYENDTWKSTFDYEDEIVIKKGKYVLGNENEVFIRPFGAQHIPNKDTINDFKTSLGVYLYYLYDTVLVNNQEDYRNIYIKIKE
jgi:hypothetical protein